MEKTTIENATEKNPAKSESTNILRGEVIRGKENISKISSEWDKLFARANDAFINLSRAWMQIFIETHNKGELCFVVVWNGSELVALLPVSVRKKFGIRIAKPVSSEIPTYLGLLLDPEYPDAAGVVAETWIKEKVANVFDDKHVSSEDKATQSLVEEFNKRGFNYKYGYKRISYGMKLGCSFDEYMQKHKSGKRRRKLNYAERQLFSSGNVEVRNYKANEITQEHLDRIAQIQEESWLKRRGASVLKETFYQKLLTNLAQAGFGSLWIMTIDGDDAAFAFTSVAHDILHYQYVAFKLKYESSLSIGQMLLMQIIRDACEKNIRYLEFGHGEGQYKESWSNHSLDVMWLVAGRGLIGNIVLSFYKTAWFLAGQKRLMSLYHRIRAFKK